MNGNINLAEILKCAPKGTSLYSPLYGYCKLWGIDNSDVAPIKVKTDDGVMSFYEDGRYYFHGECMLFPSKYNRDWSTFKAPETHKHFEPFQKVLVAPCCRYGEWIPSLYSYYDNEKEIHVLINGSVRYDDEIISYEGNEDKLGKSVN